MTLGPVLRSVLGSALSPTIGEGVGASAYAPSPAPAGYFWDFVYDTDGSRVVDLNAEPVVDLVRIT